MAMPCTQQILDIIISRCSLLERVYLFWCAHSMSSKSTKFWLVSVCVAPFSGRSSCGSRLVCAFISSHVVCCCVAFRLLVSLPSVYCVSTVADWSSGPAAVPRGDRPCATMQQWQTCTKNSHTIAANQVRWRAVSASAAAPGLSERAPSAAAEGRADRHCSSNDRCALHLATVQMREDADWRSRARRRHNDELTSISYSPRAPISHSPISHSATRLIALSSISAPHGVGGGE